MGLARRTWKHSLLERCWLLILLAAALVSTSVYLHAGAWNQDAGHCQIILTSSFLQTSNGFDASGANRPFGSQGLFRQVSFNPYVECGLTRQNALVLNLNAPLLLYINHYGSSNSAGLGDVEVGWKRRLNTAESKWAISGQVITLFPAYPADRNPAPGNHQEDVEARFLIGRGGRWVRHQVFWDAEAAYRYRSGPPADQFRADLSGGFNLSPRWMVLGQAFVIQSLGNGAPFSTSNPNAQSDFDLYKTQLSVVTRIARSTKIQAGWCDAFAGRNTGSGHTFVLAIWKNL